jgi:hypothetical protein
MALAPGPTPSGRLPVGDERVGCMGRRSPGRNMGRAPGGPDCCGRGRWKIGLPGSGRPGAGRDTAPGAGIGALYTGRGPVCGMITRGCTMAGAGGLAAVGGICAAGGCPAGPTVGTIAAGGCAAAGGRGGMATATGGAGGGGGVATALGVTTAAGGRDAATDAGVTNLGAGASAGGAVAGVLVAATDGAGASGRDTGEEAAGFEDGRSGDDTSVFPSTLLSVLPSGLTSAFCRIAFRTSPGREMFDKSILVLNSSSERLARDAFAELDDSSARDWKCLRTSTASCSSIELECVFFSVTPTAVSASRIALLLTSNSRARSLIRILLIHPLAF